MKRQLLALALSCTFILSATACGSDQGQNSSASTQNGSTSAQSATPGSSSGGNSQSQASDGTFGEEFRNETANAKENLQESISDMGNNMTDRNTTAGVPLDQMLVNAQVHDRDGDLHDGENAISDSLRP